MKRWRLLATIFFLSLTVRVLGVALTRDQPTYGDENEYMELAEGLRQDFTYPARPYRPPGYPAFIAAVWSVGPSTYGFLRIVQAVVGGLAVVLVFLVAESILGNNVAIGASALMSIYPLWIFTGTTAYPQVVVSALLYLMLLLVIRCKSELPLGYSVLIGVLIGITVLFVPVYAVLLPGLLVWLLCGRQHGRVWKRVRWWTVCTVAAIAVVSPWTIRNWVVTHEFIPVATNGPINFWLGNNPYATINTKSHLHPHAIYGKRLEQLTAQEQDRFLVRMATQHILSDPTRAFGFVVGKFIAFFRPFPGKISDSGIGVSKRIILLWLNGIFWMAIMTFGILGFILVRKQCPGVWLFAVVVLSLALLYSLFFPAIRFRTPVDGIFAILAVAAIYRITGRTKNQQLAPPAMT